MDHESKGSDEKGKDVSMVGSIKNNTYSQNIRTNWANFPIGGCRGKLKWMGSGTPSLPAVAEAGGGMRMRKRLCICVTTTSAAVAQMRLFAPRECTLMFTA